MKKTITTLAAFFLFSTIQIFAQSDCFTGSETHPGCLFLCEKMEGKLAFFTPDTTVYDANCPKPIYKRWISVIAENDFIKISLDTLKCDTSADLTIQFFDKNLIPVSSCKTFDTNSSGDFLQADNLTIGETYSVLFSTNSERYCPFDLIIDGTQTDSVGTIDSIQITRVGLTTFAKVDSTPGVIEYFWTVDDAGQIVSGQGTREIEVAYTSSNIGGICVKGISSCTETDLFCQGIYSGSDYGVCLPTINGEPAGNEAPGCFLCGPIYQGSTAGYTATAPFSAGFPCGTVENNQFISFAADFTGTLTSTIIASGCQEGVEMVIYDQNFNPISNCGISGGDNAPDQVTATGLTAGEIYWIMIDGVNGDTCDFLVTVSGGINVSPPDPPGPIYSMPDTSPVCPGAIITYSIDPVANAQTYSWSIPNNSVIVAGGSELDTFVRVQFIVPGGGTIQVAGNTGCYPGIPAIIPVVALPILPTLKPPEFICVDEFPIVRDGNIFNDFGSQEVLYTTDLGCDSIVHYNILPKIQIPYLIDTTICAGDCVQVGFDCYYGQPGGQTILLGAPFAQANGCDSVVVLRITNLEPVATIIPADPIGCNPGDVVDLDGTASSAGNGITYNWRTENGGTLAGSTNTNFTQASAPGRYILTVSQTFPSGQNCSASDTIDIVSATTPDQVVFSSAQTDVCPGSTHVYSVSTSANSLGYEWTIPSDAVILGATNEASIEITFGNQSGEICASQKGSCGNSVPVCLPINIVNLDAPAFTLTPDICILDSATIRFTGNQSFAGDFNWSFDGGQPSNVVGPGPHKISWATAGSKNVTLTLSQSGCNSPVTTETVQIEQELAAPVINCSSTTNSIYFNWAPVQGAKDYRVSSVLQTDIQTETFIEYNNLPPGFELILNVVANSDGNCPSSSTTTTCISQSCPPVTMNFDQNPQILCKDAAPIDLEATIIGGDGTGTLHWSGSGVIGDTFDPQNANIGFNTILLEVREGFCTYNSSFQIEVKSSPDADFGFSNMICENEYAQFIYTGSAGSSAIFNWDFGQGNIISGMSAGPYTVDFSGQPGTNDISLEVSENGCNSIVNTKPLFVNAAPLSPNLSCINSTTTSVEIGWDEVPGATSYIINPPIGVIDLDNRTVLIDGLMPGDEVTIGVIASNASCFSDPTTITCQSNDCPPINVSIDPIGPFCKGNSNPVSLSAMIDSGGGGMLNWSGPGVLQSSIFDPNSSAVNPGTLTVQLTYQEGICTYVATTDVEILQQPVADFSAENPICLSETSTVSYTGNADPTATFNWNFGSTGNIVSGSGTPSDPYEINWIGSGAKEITLVVEENGCNSDTAKMLVQVDDILSDPVITCDSDVNNISFSWGVVSGASTYVARVIDSNVTGLPTTQTDQFSWNFSGLSPGDYIEIEVTAMGSTTCGTSSATVVCAALDCPDYFVVMPSLIPCFTSNTTVIDLTQNFQVTNLSGDDLIDSINLIWFGAGGTNTYLTSDGLLNPIAAVAELGVGDIPISIEIEYPKGSGCFRTHTSTIRLNPAPSNSIILPAEICFGESATMSLSDSVSSSSTNLDWNFGNATVLSGTGAGPYELSWDSVFHGITDTLSVVITENGCSSAPISQTINLNNGLNLAAVFDTSIWNPAAPTNLDLSVLNGTPDYDFLWSNGVDTEDLIGVPSGTYCVTVTDQNGCEGQECFDISSGIYRINPAQIVCQNEPTQLVIRPGRGADFEWTPATGLSCTDCSNPIVTPSKSTTYTVKATLPSGRFSETKVLVIVLPSFFCNMAKTNDEVSRIIKNSELDFYKSEEKDLIEIENYFMEVLTDNPIKISPNPTTGIVNISSLHQIENVEVFDFSGRKLFDKKAAEIDLSAFAKGVYFLKIKSQNQTAVKRVVKN